jgi:hypothetical protein
MRHILWLGLVAMVLGAPRSGSAQDSEALNEQVLVAMVQTYNQAVEAKDEAVLRDDLYRGPIPGDNRRFLRALFTRTEQLSVTYEPRGLEFKEDGAVATIECTLSFRHARTGEQKTTRFRLRLIFEPSENGWRLKKTERG